MAIITNIIHSVNSYFFDTEETDLLSGLLFYAALLIGIAFTITFTVLNIKGVQ